MTNEVSVDFRKNKSRNFAVTFVLCAVCLGINFLCFGLAKELKLPLYLDNVGILLASMFGGYLPGIFVGFMTNIVNCFSDTSSIYYGVISVLNAVIGGYFAQKGWVSFKKPAKMLFLITLLAIVGGGLGTLLPWFLDGVYFDSESIAKFLIAGGLEDPTMAQLLGNLIMDVADKFVTVFVVVIIYSIVPKKLKAKLRFNGWMQRPMSDEDREYLTRMGVRKISVRTKIMLLMTAAMMLMGAVAVIISFILFDKAALEQHTKLVNGVADLAASFVDGDSVDRWLLEGKESEGYAQTEKLLYDLKDSNSEIEYIYVYKIKKDGCHVVFDLDSGTVKGSQVGYIEMFDDVLTDADIPALLAGAEPGPMISRGTAYGDLLTKLRPIYDSAGQLVAYAGADVTMSVIDGYDRNFFTGMSSLFFAFFILIFAVVMWVVEYHIVLPVNSMAKCTDKFAFSSNESLGRSIGNIRDIEIQTGDEIENLYEAIVKMAGDSAEHLDDISRKNKTISKMQNALILVLADMVESRDKNTGDHVRKTAAYSRVIMKQLRKLGYYTDELTDKFIYDVGNSAPLHDVGKIKVSDMILNKPGRLTDEEFVQMQRHTSVGGEILDQVIDLVPDADYLYEARNLAMYHHEKWDGNGYPEGLSGIAIPLSARIMAVADVFDALVSKRSYKEPFSFEQACDIIREGSGTHFDPKVVEAFLSAEDECRDIAKSFGNDLITGYVNDDHVDDSGNAR